MITQKNKINEQNKSSYISKIFGASFLKEQPVSHWKVQVHAFPGFPWKTFKNIVHKQGQTIKHSFSCVTPSMHVLEWISQNKLQGLLHETFFISVPMGENLNKSLFLLFNMESYPFAFHQGSSSSFFYFWPGSRLRNSTHYFRSHCWC